jgi:hypothetical protein
MQIGHFVLGALQQRLRFGQVLTPRMQLGEQVGKLIELISKRMAIAG